MPFRLSVFLFTLLVQNLHSAENAHEAKEPVKAGPISSMIEKTLDKFSRKENEDTANTYTQTKVINPQAPKPFNISYKVSINGLPTGLEAKSKLRKHENNYNFTLDAESWMLSYQEKSVFRWDKNAPCELLTEHYQFNFEGFGQTEAFEVEINHDLFLANSQTRKGKVQYEVPGNVSDALAYLFKLQCDLKNNNLNPNYNIAYNNGVDNYVFEYQGKETLKTSLGELETIVLKRVYQDDNIETIYWIAPGVDYLMVKMKHKQGKVVTAVLKIKSIDYELNEALPNKITQDDKTIVEEDE